MCSERVLKNDNDSCLKEKGDTSGEVKKKKKKKMQVAKVENEENDVKEEL